MSQNEALLKLFSSLETFKQQQGYGGAVTHYWGDSLDYIGPAFDWRYEGLICGFAQLYKKTSNKYFLNLAIESGDFIVANQIANGSFRNCGFESNPSFGETYQPHLAGSLIGLLGLVSLLKETGVNYSKYLDAASKSAEFIYSKFYNSWEKVFYQYEHKRAAKVENPIVPNKICTISEAMLLYHSLTGEKKYLQAALNSAEHVLALQEKEDKKMKGGIYQSNDRKKLITYYTSRCIPFLVLAYNKTKDKRFIESAKSADNFVQKHWTGSGFKFGYEIVNQTAEQRTFPYFAAGSADILRANLSLGKKIPKEQMTYLLEQQNLTGGFRSFSGLAHKNTSYSGKSKETWQDHIPCAGWNDKVLRLLSLTCESDFEYEKIPFETEKIELGENTYYEDSKKIEICGEENYCFGKQNKWSGGNSAQLSKVRLIGKFFIKKLSGL